jgi:hypothetical protein
MKAAAAAAFALMRFIRSCVSALFGDFRLSAYDPVMQVIPPGELYFDIVAVGVLALVSRILILGFMALVAKGYEQSRPACHCNTPTIPLNSHPPSPPCHLLTVASYAPYDSSSTTIHFPPQLQVALTSRQSNRNSLFPQDQSLDSPPYFAAAAGVPWTAYNNWYVF